MFFSRKKCPNCGAKNPKDSISCGKCWTSFASMEIEQHIFCKNLPETIGTEGQTLWLRARSWN